VQPLTTRQLNRACHAAAQMAEIEKRVSLHTLCPSTRDELIRPDGAGGGWRRVGASLTDGPVVCTRSFAEWSFNQSLSFSTAAAPHESSLMLRTS
jgi:hypothetical protein